jgi:RP/EB family microtubule-associated protein
MAGRTDLLAWLNELLQINYTKIEQCGTGAAYCQILDSIYGDIPMNRVKFNAKHEYEFIANFKVMQNVFKAKKIDKPIPVDKLIKCKMQDNLEFLQWMKRYWDGNYGGQGYEAIARRKGAPADPPATIAPLSTGRSSSSGSNHLGVSARAGGRTPVGHRAGSTQPNETVQQLQTQLKDMQTHLEGLEKERDFYFAKLRDIEILVQAQMEAAEVEGRDVGTFKKIQEILYSTEDGFEVPDPNAAPIDEEETF